MKTLVISVLIAKASASQFQEDVLKGYLFRRPNLTLESMRSIHGNYLASIHNGNAMAEAVGFFHIMGSIENGHTPVPQPFNSLVDHVP